MTTVLLAPDKFKGSLQAAEVARALARGISTSAPSMDVVVLPVADGGDGTVDAAVAAGFRRIEARVTGPTGTLLSTSYARRNDVAVIEMADACGLKRLPDVTLRPLSASSRGLGEVMLAALEAGARDIVIGLGGSASTDGGAGMLSALGARVLDERGSPAPDGGAGLPDVAHLDVTELHPALGNSTITVACDVDNPLVGPSGAAHVYGPQKGADQAQVLTLEAGLEHWADKVTEATGCDARHAAGTGAAGGVGFAALAVLGARMASGIDLLLDLIGFRHALEKANLVVTGEGCLDAQSLSGKAPIGVARAARRAGVPVVAVCGRRLIGEEALRAAGFEAVYALADRESDLAVCIQDADRLVADIGERLGRLLLTDDALAGRRPGTGPVVSGRLDPGLSS